MMVATGRVAFTGGTGGGGLGTSGLLLVAPTQPPRLVAVTRQMIVCPTSAGIVYPLAPPEPGM
jgi:uncharacterized membrane protein YfcA